MPNRFKKHPSGILIGRTYKINTSQSERFFSEVPERRKEVLKSWQSTHEQIKEATNQQVERELSEVV